MPIPEKKTETEKEAGDAGFGGNLIAVLSLSRSGSSLISRILSEVLDVNFGEAIEHLPPNRYNPDGYFENFEFLKLNEEILKAAGGEVFNPPDVQYFRKLGDETISRLTGELKRGVSQSSGASPRYGVKDPRLALTFPVWKAAFPGVSAVIIFRNPTEAAFSMDEQNAIGWDRAIELWYEYYYRIFYYTAGLKRHVVSFDALIARPAETAMGLAEAFGFDITREELEKRVAGIIRPERIKFKSRSEKVQYSPYVDAKTKLIYDYLERCAADGAQPDMEHLGGLFAGINYFETEYKKSLKELLARQAETDNTIREIEEKLAHKEALIVDINERITEKDAQLAEKDAQLAEKDAQLAETQNIKEAYHQLEIKHAAMISARDEMTAKYVREKLEEAEKARVLYGVFDEKAYLAQNPDVARVIRKNALFLGFRKGFSSGWEHWDKYGRDEVRRGVRRYTPPSPKEDFDEASYLEQNPDVAEAVKAGNFASGKEHWIRHGRGEIMEGRRSYTPPKYPKVSVVAAVYNKQESLPSFIEAFSRQTYPGRMEIIFVDDVSTDNSREVIAGAVERFNKEAGSLSLKLITNSANSGNCRSRERGLEEADGKIVFIMDADCIVNRAFVSEHLESHQRDEYQIVTGPMNIETNGRDPFALLDELGADPRRVERECALQDPVQKDSFLNNITRNFSIKRLYVHKGLFDEDFSYSKNPNSGFGWEDVDMGYRLYLRGLRSIFNPRAITVHMSHPSSVREEDKPVKSVKNLRLLFDKHVDFENVAPDWSVDTVGKLENWLNAVGKGRNEDLEELKKRIGSPTAAPVRHREAGRRLKILNYRWHCGHQYELYKLPHDFTLAMGGGITSEWDYGVRPKPGNAKMVPLDALDMDGFDMAILHFDEFTLNPSLARGILDPDWGDMFRRIHDNFKGPKVAICHGYPYFYGACMIDYHGGNLGVIVEEERKRFTDFLGDTLVICNSHRAQRDWGFANSRVIWHGFDPKEYPPTTYRTWAINASGQMLNRPHYRGLTAYLRILNKLNYIDHGRCPTPDFLGDRLSKQVTTPKLNWHDFKNPNDFGMAQFVNYVNFLRSYSVFINTTVQSPMPRIRGEGMMLGLAMVTQNYSDEDMFIDNGINGFYSNNPDELAQVVADMWKNPKLAMDMGMRGRKRAIEAFHINDYLNEWNKVINDVMGENVTPSPGARRTRYELLKRQDSPVPSIQVGGGPSVLFLSGVGGDTERYRIDHIAEALGKEGIKSRKLFFSSVDILPHLMDLGDQHNMAVLHRVPISYGFPYDALNNLRRKGLKIIFDTDDLVFSEEYPLYFAKMGLSSFQMAGLVEMYRETLKYCGVATCSTDYLKERLEAVGVRAHILRNCVSSEMIRLSRQAVAARQNDKRWVDIGYASGTPTHKMDFAMVADYLAEIMKKRENTRLHVVGFMDMPPSLKKFGDRVFFTPFVPWKNLPAIIAGFDINIAPLVEGESFCQSKSELKWLEGALVKVPSVCSRTDAFNYAIKNGEDGFLASGPEWLERLDALVGDAKLRRRMGERAHEKAMSRYTPEARGVEARELYIRLLKENL